MKELRTSIPFKASSFLCYSATVGKVLIFDLVDQIGAFGDFIATQVVNGVGACAKDAVRSEFIAVIKH